MNIFQKAKKNIYHLRVNKPSKDFEKSIHGMERWMQICSYFPNRLGYSDDDWKEDIEWRVGLEYRKKNLTFLEKFTINDLILDFDKIFFAHTNQLKRPLFVPSNYTELIFFSRIPKKIDSDFIEYVLKTNEIIDKDITDFLYLDSFDKNKNRELDTLH